MSSAAAVQTAIPLRHYYFSLSHPKEGTALYFSTLQHETMSLFFFLICNGDAENTPASIKLLPLTTAGLQQATACPHFQQHCCTLIFH